MNTLDDELFYACTNYIEAINHYKTALYDVEHNFMHSQDKEHIMAFERSRVRSAIEILERKLNRLKDKEIE